MLRKSVLREDDPRQGIPNADGLYKSEELALNQPGIIDPKQSGPTVTQRIGLALTGNLGNVLTQHAAQKERARLAQEQRVHQIRKEIMGAVTQNYRESQGTAEDKQVYSEAIKRLFGEDSTEFQSLFQKKQVQGNIPPEELEGLGGGPNQKSMVEIDEPVLHTKQNKEKYKAQSRLIYNKDGSLVGQGYFKPSDGVTYGPNNKPIDGTKQYGIAALAKGDAGSFGGTTAANKDLDSEIATRNVVTLGESLKGLINRKDFVGGTAGTAISMVNSFAQQAKQLTGNSPIIDNTLNMDMVDGKNTSKENLSFMRQAAINKDRVGSAVIQLAYILAKIQDPGGRISDADFGAAKSMIDGSADKRSILARIDDLQKRAITIRNNRIKAQNSRSKTQQPLLNLEALKGTTQGSPEESKAMDSLVEETLKDMGL